jgi:hypothetical protein
MKFHFVAYAIEPPNVPDPIDMTLNDVAIES